MLADCQYSLYLSAGLEEGWSDEEFGDATIKDCYIQAKSTANVRVERLWFEQRHTTTGTWIRYFNILETLQPPLFQAHRESDKVVLCFIFMPIIRQQLSAFVQTHNANPIRKQRNRLLHVPGVPDELYDNEDLRCGIRANETLLDIWQQEVANYDIDAYLTVETATWCQALMHELGHPSPPVIEEFVTPETDIIPEFLRQMIGRARLHAARELHPVLALALRPEGGYSADMRALIVAGYQEELEEGDDQHQGGSSWDINDMNE